MEGKNKYIVVRNGKINLSDVINDCTGFCFPTQKDETLSSILKKICAKLNTIVPQGPFISEEVDPIFQASPVFGIGYTDISQWNSAYNNQIVSATFTGTGTKTLTLVQQDGGTITTSFVDLDSYTDEQAQDAIAAMLANTATISFTYNDGVPSLTFDLIVGGTDNSQTNIMVWDGTSIKLRDVSSIIGHVQVGANTLQLGTLVFSNSNNVSFGLNGSTLTASASFSGTFSGSSATISAGSQSDTLGQLVFSNSNNVVFGLDNGTITASASYPQTSSLSGTGIVSVSVNGGTISIGAPAPAVSGSNGSFTFSTLSFGNSNGFSFYTSNGSVVGSYTAAEGADGYNIIAAGSQTADTTGTVILSNSNGISFGMSNNSVVTASYTVPTDYVSTAQSSLFQYSSQMSDYLDTSYTAHTHSQYLTTQTQFVLSNSNGISFGTNASTVTASYTVPVVTNSSATISGGASSETLSNLVFSNSNNVSFGLSNGTITASMSYTNPTVTNSSWTISADTRSETVGELILSNSNGVSFGLTGGTVTASVRTDYQSSGNYLTTAMQSDAGSNFVNSSAGLNLTNISATLGSNSLSLSVAAQSNQPVAASASNGSFLFSTLKFVETNGVTWATSTDGIRASVQTNYQSTGNYLTTAAQSTQTLAFSLGGNSATTNSSRISNGGYVLAGGNGVTLQQSNNTVSISVATNYQSQGAYLTTADLSQNSSKYVQNWKLTGNTAGTTSSAQGTDLWVSGGNNITVSGSSNSIVLSVGNYLTTAMASNRGTDFVQATAVFNGTNASGTIANNNISVSVNPETPFGISAGSQSVSTGTLIFSNSNGITFGMSGSSRITASYTVPTVTNSSFSVQDSATTLNPVARIAFSTGNNITLSLSTGASSATVGVQHNLAGTSSGFAGNLISGSMTHNSSGLNLSLNHPAWLTTAMQSNAATISNINVSAGATSNNLSALTFANSNGVTFGLNASTITASVNAAGNSSLSITADNGSSLGSLSQLYFKNANSLSFGLSTSNNGSATLTGSFNYTVPTLTNSSLTIGAGGSTLSSVSQIVFSNANGVSFLASTSNNGSITISGSVQTNYLTTAALSSQTLAFSLSGNTATTNSSQILNGGYALAGGNGVTLQQSNNTVSISVATNYQSQGAYLTTAALSSQTLAFSLSGNTATTNSSQILNGGYALAGGNGVTLQQSNNTISVSVATNYQSQGAYLTTADLSQNSSKYVQNWKLTGNTAGTTSSAQGTDFWLAGGNNITVSGSSNTISFSVGNYLTTAMASNASTQFVQANAGFNGTNASGTIASNGISVSVAAQSNPAFSASGGSSTFQTLSFVNSNGFTFSNTNGSVRASYTVPTVTNSSLSVTAGNGSSLGSLSQLYFANSNNFSFGLSTSNNGSATLTASYTVPTVTNSSWTVSDAATSGTVGRLAFTNLNGVTLSLSSGTGGLHTIVGSHNALTSQSNQALSAANGSFTFQTATFANSNGVSFSTGTQGIYATVQTNYLTSQSNQAVSNSAGSFTFQTLNFSNANNVTFGTSAGGIITASVAAPGAAAENNWVNLLGANTDGNTTASGSTIGYSGINLTLSGTNNSVVNISAPATSVLSALGGLTISTTGSTINLSAGGGGGLTLSYFNPQDAYLQVAGQQGLNTIHIQPCQAPNVTFDRIVFPIYNSGASNSAGTATLTISCALYTRNVSTLAQSTSWSATQTYVNNSQNSSSLFRGIRLVTASANNSISEGQYWMAIASSTAAGGNNQTLSQVLASQMNSNFSGIPGQSIANTYQYTKGLGRYSATSGGFPSNIAFSEIYGTESMILRQPIFYFLYQTV
jgi:hypothetical protein